MGKLRNAVMGAVFLGILAAPTVGASQPATRGLLAANARPFGHPMVELASSWNVWGFGRADDNPLLAVRCERSPIDQRIWFLPVSLGGEYENTCDVPQGAVLVLFAGGSECSNLEPEPYYGADESDLRACLDETFPLLTYIEITFNGKTTTNLDDYIVTTTLTTLPPDNLISSSSGWSMNRGYFLAVGPLSRGTHSLHAYDEFYDGGFQAGITYTINVR